METLIILLLAVVIIGLIYNGWKYQQLLKSRNKTLERLEQSAKEIEQTHQQLAEIKQLKLKSTKVGVAFDITATDSTASDCMFKMTGVDIDTRLAADRLKKAFMSTDSVIETLSAISKDAESPQELAINSFILGTFVHHLQDRFSGSSRKMEQEARAAKEALENLLKNREN